MPAVEDVGDSTVAVAAWTVVVVADAAVEEWVAHRDRETGRVPTMNVETTTSPGGQSATGATHPDQKAWETIWEEDSVEDVVAEEVSATEAAAEEDSTEAVADAVDSETEDAVVEDLEIEAVDEEDSADQEDQTEVVVTDARGETNPIKPSHTSIIGTSSQWYRTRKDGARGV